MILHRNLSRIGGENPYGIFVCDANGKKGLMNKSGKLIVPFGKYTDIVGMCNESRFVIVKNGNKVGAVDYTTGKQIIPPVYNAFGYSGLEGRTVWSKKTTTGYQYFIFNKSGGLIAQRAFTRTNRAVSYWIINYLGHNASMEEYIFVDK